MSLFTIQLAKKGKPVKIQKRSLNDGFNSSEEMSFTDVLTDVLAIICTPNGKRVVDEVGIEQTVTHEFHMKWPGFDITVENWVYFTAKSKRYRVLSAKNCCEKDEEMILYCTERGKDDRGAAGA